MRSSSRRSRSIRNGNAVASVGLALFGLFLPQRRKRIETDEILHIFGQGKTVTAFFFFQFSTSLFHSIIYMLFNFLLQEIQHNHSILSTLHFV